VKSSEDLCLLIDLLFKVVKLNLDSFSFSVTLSSSFSKRMAFYNSLLGGDEFFYEDKASNSEMLIFPSFCSESVKLSSKINLI
jgi:hypothetical protein